MAASPVMKLTARTFTTADRDGHLCVVLATYVGRRFAGAVVATFTPGGDLHA